MSWRHGEIVPITRLLEWNDTREDSQQKQGEVLLSLSMTSWSGRSSTCGWKRNRPRVYGSGLKVEQGQDIVVGICYRNTWSIMSWLVTANMASVGTISSWKIWPPTMIELRQWLIREVQLTSPAWICAKHFILSSMPSLSFNCRDINLMSGLYIE